MSESNPRPNTAPALPPPSELQRSMYLRDARFIQGLTLLDDLSFSCHYHHEIPTQLWHLFTVSLAIVLVDVALAALGSPFWTLGLVFPLVWGLHFVSWDLPTGVRFEHGDLCRTRAPRCSPCCAFAVAQVYCTLYSLSFGYYRAHTEPVFSCDDNTTDLPWSGGCPCFILHCSGYYCPGHSRRRLTNCSAYFI